jgi:hypothetical protein
MRDSQKYPTAVGGNAGRRRSCRVACTRLSARALKAMQSTVFRGVAPVWHRQGDKPRDQKLFRLSYGDIERVEICAATAELASVVPGSDCARRSAPISLSHY